MHEDIERNGKVYRIISEPTNICHPEGAVVAVFEMKRPTPQNLHPRADELWKETCDDSQIRVNEMAARHFVEGL